MKIQKNNYFLTPNRQYCAHPSAGVGNMAVHALHIFDRKGKTLFTKRYSSSPSSPAQDAEQLSELRKLIFGMLFSLRELVGNLTPEGASPGA